MTTTYQLDLSRSVERLVSLDLDLVLAQGSSLEEEEVVLSQAQGHMDLEIAAAAVVASTLGLGIVPHNRIHIHPSSPSRFGCGIRHGRGRCNIRRTVAGEHHTVEDATVAVAGVAAVEMRRILEEDREATLGRRKGAAGSCILRRKPWLVHAQRRAEMRKREKDGVGR